MTHVFYNPDSIDWSGFIASQQAGRGEQQKGKNYGGQGRRGQQWTNVQKYSDISANNHAIDRTVPIKRRRNKIIDQLSFP